MYQYAVHNGVLHSKAWEESTGRSVTDLAMSNGPVRVQMGTWQ